MPLRHFLCPDEETRLITQCLEACPRNEGRCMALAHLIAIGGGDRKWEGKMSVTQLIKGTRQAFLGITQNYAVNPDDQAFALYGRLHHKRLEIINRRLEGLTEQKLTAEISGTLDKLEPDELHPSKYKLIDYKLVGAYSVAKALGLTNNEGQADMRDWELQLNKYRILLEGSEFADLFPVSRMFIQATIRDSGLKQMKSLGIPQRMPLIPVKKIDDSYVNEFFLSKEYALTSALKKGTLPDICSYEERWGNRRCTSGFCPVFYFCPEGAKMNRVQLHEA